MEKIEQIINSIVNLLNKTSEFLSGYKTFIVGVIMIIVGLIYGDKQMVLTGLGLIAIRDGINKTFGRAK